MTTTNPVRVDLPRHCPPWCTSDHRQALAEFNAGEDLVPESICQHRSDERNSGLLLEVRDTYEAVGAVLRPGAQMWGMELLQDVRDPANSRCGVYPEFIELYVSGRDDRRAWLQLRPGEARSMAAALVAFADLAELPYLAPRSDR